MSNETSHPGAETMSRPTIQTEVTPETGHRIKFNASRWIALQETSDYPSVPGFSGAAFRVYLFNAGVHVGVNVTITGRYTRWDSDGRFVTCRVEYVGDCEASEYQSGQLYLDDLAPASTLL